MRLSGFCALVAISLISTLPLPRAAMAGEAQAAVLGPSGLPLPRFVSFKAARVNLRIGPGTNYPVDWMYLKSGLPVEIVQEYDNWRRIRDAEGTEGWVSQGLLSGKRTALAAPWQAGKDLLLELKARPETPSATIASIEPGAMGAVTTCSGQWCLIEFEGHQGWIDQSQLWGVYPGETLK